MDERRNDINSLGRKSSWFRRPSMTKCAGVALPPAFVEACTRARSAAAWGSSRSAKRSLGVHCHGFRSGGSARAEALISSKTALNVFCNRIHDSHLLVDFPGGSHRIDVDSECRGPKDAGGAHQSSVCQFHRVHATQEQRAVEMIGR